MEKFLILIEEACRQCTHSKESHGYYCDLEQRNIFASCQKCLGDKFEKQKEEQ